MPEPNNPNLRKHRDRDRVVRPLPKYPGLPDAAETWEPKKNPPTSEEGQKCARLYAFRLVKNFGIKKGYKVLLCGADAHNWRGKIDHAMWQIDPILWETFFDTHQRKCEDGHYEFWISPKEEEGVTKADAVNYVKRLRRTKKWRALVEEARLIEMEMEQD